MSEGAGNETPITYEQVLEAMRALEQAGVRDPEANNTPEIKVAMDLLQKYDNQELARCAREADPESARAEWGIQRNAIFIDAGFDSRDRLNEVLSWSQGDYLQAKERNNLELASKIEAKIRELLIRMGREDEIEDFLSTED